MGFLYENGAGSEAGAVAPEVQILDASAILIGSKEDVVDEMLWNRQQ